MDVSLVSMPFAEVQRPSIALGLLNASLVGTPIRSDVIYGNLRFAEIIGLRLYQSIVASPADHLLGEWCFADVLFPDFHRDDEAYLDLVLAVRSPGLSLQLDKRKAAVRTVRVQAKDFLNHMVTSILAQRPRIVGCSSMFQQHAASLALLKRIREECPDTVTLMGGANCEGEMGAETLRSFPWVDYVVSGEADDLFPDLCRLLLAHGRHVDASDLPGGVMAQTPWRVNATAAPHLGADPVRRIVRHLDALPIPDYAAYFDALRSSPLCGHIRPGLPVESSRGCWWGEISHCTFCGLNGIGMSYRSKSPARVLTEISTLSKRYGVDRVEFVDNILDLSHIDTVLSSLAAAGAPYSLFYETKSNVTRRHLRTLVQAGVRWIQPGIESLHDGVLGLIAKGNTALMNVQLLKWAREFGIRLTWNLLYGFPGESDTWYAEMASWLPSIFHLQPPADFLRVRYDRFSPYHTQPQDYGLRLNPGRAYASIYPLPDDALRRLAYAFEDAGQPQPLHRGIPMQPGHRTLAAVVQQWRWAWQAHRRRPMPVLCLVDEGDRLRLVDTRPGAQVPHWIVDGLAMAVYRLCDRVQTPRSLQRHLREQQSEEVTPQAVNAAVEALCRATVLLRLDGKLLSLGVSGHGPALPRNTAFPGGYASVYELR
jgi:ribosomal peptide maturation radical SAM protein 1